MNNENHLEIASYLLYCAINHKLKNLSLTNYSNWYVELYPFVNNCNISITKSVRIETIITKTKIQANIFGTFCATDSSKELQISEKR